MEESQKQVMIDAYEKRLLSQTNGMKNSALLQMCLAAFRHGILSLGNKFTEINHGNKEKED